MPQPPLSDEKCQEAVDAMALHGTVTAAALALNLNRATFEGRVREARRRGFVSTHPPRLVLKGQSIFHGPDGSEQGRWDKTKQEGREPADSVQLPDPKKIVKLSTLYDQQGKVTQQWIAEKPEDAAREALWLQFAESLSRDIKPAKPIAKPKGFSHDDLLAGYPVGDHHTGMMAWPLETGDAAWDLKIAEQSIREAALRLIGTCPPCKQAVIPFLGDFFHYDSYAAVTPAHRNLLDADGRYPKMVETGVRIIRHIVTAALERHQHVTVVFKGGNHDPSTSACIRIFLACLYENEPRVTVDTSAMEYSYLEFGKNLFGFQHGDKAKPERLPGIMAHDMPEAWGRTEFRVWWTGHVHKVAVMEFPGCFVESIPVLPPLDAYAAGAGYRSKQQMKAVVFHREHGEVERHTVHPGMFNAKVAA
jgi:hypothetical protein